MEEKTNVPKIPRRIFEWYCDPQRFEELHGDLEEMFLERLATSGPFHAKFRYTIDVIRCCQPYAWRKHKPRNRAELAIVRNYLNVAMRGMLRNWSGSFINIAGLSIAIGICILAYGFIQWDRNIDQFHTNAEEVFLITSIGEHGGRTEQYGTTPRPLGEMLRQQIGEGNRVCRVDDGSAVVKSGDNVYYETVRYVDPEFLSMFTFPLKWGSAASLSDPGSVILSNKTSVKYFGDQNPVGELITIRSDNHTEKVFKIAGVAEEFPVAHDIDFTFLVNYENRILNDPFYNRDDWKELVNATFVQVRDLSVLQQIAPAMASYVGLQNQAHPEIPIAKFEFEQLTTLHHRSGNMLNSISQDYNREGRIGMPVLAIFMLALACFNCINIAIVSATRRLKEIGVRKVIGANRARMIFQFLSENILVTSFALLFGFILSITLFIPWFENFSGGEMRFEVFQPNLFIFLAALLLFTAIASGLYPALYISRFDAVRIFRGSVEFGKRNPLTKLFLGVQIVLACLLITAGVVFTQNNTYQSHLSWGYDQKGLLYAQVSDSASFDKLKATMSSYSSVVSISGSNDHIGKKSTPSILQLTPATDLNVGSLSVDAGYFETMGLQLIEGRTFREHSDNDLHTVVINENLAEAISSGSPVGTLVTLNETKFEIIGVVRDFHSKNFFNKIEPALFTLATESDNRFLSIRVKSGTEQSTYRHLQQQWSQLFPDIPFNGGYQEDVWGMYFHRVDRSEQFNKVVATIAILLASLGLYGLVSMNVAGRSKEFSIRRTLGANIRHIAAAILNQYVLLITISILIAIPLSYYFTNAYLHMLFAYPMDVGYSGILIAIVILISILLGVVGTQIRRAVMMNTVEGLKRE